MTGATTRGLLVVIDAQRAFADPHGSLATAYGSEEIQPNLRALACLRQFLVTARALGMPTVFVRSEYLPGQFTDGRLDHPLSRLCVPAANIDCEWAVGLDVAGAHRLVTKRQADAMATPEYRDVVAQAVAEGADTVYFAGFQLTTCVRATAISTVAFLKSSVTRAAVLRSCTGARASSYHSIRDGPSRAQQAFDELTAAGIELVDGPEVDPSDVNLPS